MKFEDHKETSGVLLLDKPRNKTSFNLVAGLRRIFQIQKIGHAGTLDPFATGVMVMLVGREYTRLSDSFLAADKEYLATIQLGAATDTYDCDGQTLYTSSLQPSLDQLKQILPAFQGEIDQIPPMFSAKKLHGKKLYELARKGIEVERAPVKVTVDVQLISYQYPTIDLYIRCSKGTYIRSIADELGKILGCGGHLIALRRTRSGSFRIEECIDGSLLDQPDCDATLLKKHLILLKN